MSLEKYGILKMCSNSVMAIYGEIPFQLPGG